MNKLVAIALLVLLASCGQSKVNLKNEEDKIVQCWVDWPKKTISGDGTFYFSDSAVFMGQGQPPINGKEEIAKHLSTFAKIPGLTVNWGERPNIIEFSEDGGMAYSVDIQEFSMSDSTGTVSTKVNQALHVWRKDKDGNWKVSFLLMYPKK